MASLHRNLALLLFFIAPLLPSHLYTHAASTSPPVTHPRILFITGLGSEDDDDEPADYVDVQKTPPEVILSMRTPLLQGEPQFCQYDSCAENQEPCSRLSEKTGCLCPGMSGADRPPHPPRIQALLPVKEGKDRGKVEVQWCAPSSVVSGYKVVVEGANGVPLEFRDTFRRGLVGSLEVGAKVCVEAVNSAGHSSSNEFSCQRYDPPVTTDHKLLFGVIGGGVAILLILIIGSVVLWKFNICGKGKGDSADGLGNPSYSRGGTL